MKLSVIVPCYNEGESLNEFYDAVSKRLELEKITHEFIMVDDGSSDNTMDVLKNLSSKDKCVKVISFSRNFGKEAAMYAGLKACSGEYVSIMDADLQHTPDTLIMMYNKLIQNKDYDIVASYKENREDESSIKRTLTSLFYRFNNMISNVKLLPGASDFRVFKSCVRDAIISLPEEERFLKGMFSWVGFNTIYVPYTPSKRLHGNSKWSLIKLIKYSLSGIISFSTKPNKFIFILGVVTFLIGFLNFILFGSLANKTIILFLSFIMLSIGILSLYISRIYKRVLNRPCYIVKEKIGFNSKK